MSTNPYSSTGESAIGPMLCPHAQRKVEEEPNIANTCTWKMNTTEKCPHIMFPRKKLPGILPSVLDFVGETPIIRINKIKETYGVTCDVVAKCEFFSAGGSVKDRIGKRMVLEAEASGRLKKGDVIIEPTSGNTGIGLALAAAVRGYRTLIVLPEKMSSEKVNTLKALGAEIVRTPTEAASESPESHINVAARLNAEIPNSHILDQYQNPANPLAHYEGTAEEMWAQCEGKIDMAVMGTGTGGTITGVARRLKELNPNIIIVGVDPYGSILAQPETLNPTTVTGYHVEGTGYDFLPKVFDRSVVDQWIKVVDADTFPMSRRLIKEEGLLCGGSSGGTMWAAMQAAKQLKEGQRCVVLLADGVRNYMTKFLTDAWMVENGFMEQDPKELSKSWWATKKISDLSLSPSPITVTPETTCKEAITFMAQHGFDMVPVQNSSGGSVQGVITEGNLTALLVKEKISPNDPVSKAMYKQFKKVSNNTTLAELALQFDREPYVLVVAEQQVFSSGESTSLSVVTGVATRIDLLNFIANENA
jgi:cystathionine beta-synthase